MKVSKDVEVNESGFVFDANTGDTFTINDIGREIVGLLKQGETKEEIVESLSSDYDVKQSVLEKDVSEFLLMLKYFKLVKK